MRFLVLGLPKTGKTMLCHTLNRLDNFRVLGEIMNTRGPNPNMPDHPQPLVQAIRVRDTKYNINTWYTKKYEFFQDITNRLVDTDIDEFMKTIYLSDKNCAFKLHHHHIEMLPYLLDWFLDRPDIRIIHCNRQNKIKQAIAAMGNRHRGKKFYADPVGALDLMDDNHYRLQQLRNWFCQSDYYQEFYYEDMTGDTDKNTLNLKNIRKFLGVDMPDKIDILTRKNTQDKVSENLDNYKEFADYFKNSSYQEFID